MMNEFELIYQLKQLKEIKPQKDWVVLCKNQILDKEDFSEKFSIISIFQNLFFIKKFKPVYIVSTGIMLLFIGAVSFFLLTGKEKPIEIAETPTKPESTKEIVLALGDLQKEIDQTIISLEEIKEPQRVLETRNVIVPFVQATKEVLAQLEKAELEQNVRTDNKVLAVKQSVENLESAQESTIAKLANNLIQFLKTRTLTETQQEVLKQAEQAYNEGNYHQALIDVMLVQQLIERR